MFAGKYFRPNILPKIRWMWYTIKWIRILIIGDKNTMKILMLMTLDLLN